MKIVQETPEKLILKQGALGNIVFGILFAAIGIVVNFVANQNILVARIIGLIFIISGGFMIVFSKFIKISISQSLRKINIEYSGVLGKNSHDLLFNEIKEVAIEEYATTQTASSGARLQMNYNLTFYKQTGEGIAIGLNSPGGLIIMGIPTNLLSGRNNIIELGNKVAAFIGVPFVNRRPPSVSDVISSIQTTIKAQQPMGQTPQSVQTLDSIINKV